ncbi:MAG: hypothetical protein GY907_08995 [Bacteroidetes bacterium]|jgi:hypothetical protein|nr:hypothetical protein [Bacteroidota bacterium]
MYKFLLLFTTRILVVFSMALILLIPQYVVSQGINKVDISSLTVNELSKMVESREFASGPYENFANDQTNNYYVLSTQDIEHKFVTLYILEQSYNSNFMVNIGSSSDFDLHFFLVNKVHGKTDLDIYTELNTYIDKANNAIESMNQEQLRLWELQHNKFSSK